MEIREHWERTKHYLEPALDGSYTLDDVWTEISDDRAQFWPLPNGAVVTQVLEFPQRRVLRIWLAGGRLDEFQFAVERATEYAIHRGCSAVEIDGRKGWQRALAGFKQTRVVLSKEIEV